MSLFEYLRPKWCRFVDFWHENSNMMILFLWSLNTVKIGLKKLFWKLEKSFQVEVVFDWKISKKLIKEERKKVLAKKLFFAFRQNFRSSTSFWALYSFVSSWAEKRAAIWGRAFWTKKVTASFSRGLFLVVNAFVLLSSTIKLEHSKQNYFKISHFLRAERDKNLKFRAKILQTKKAWWDMVARGR